MKKVRLIFNPKGAKGSVGVLMKGIGDKMKEVVPTLANLNM
jgi:hypothetical protein